VKQFKDYVDELQKRIRQEECRKREKHDKQDEKIRDWNEFDLDLRLEILRYSLLANVIPMPGTIKYLAELIGIQITDAEAKEIYRAFLKLIGRK